MIGFRISKPNEIRIPISVSKTETTTTTTTAIDDDDKENDADVEEDVAKRQKLSRGLQDLFETVQEVQFIEHRGEFP